MGIAEIREFVTSNTVNGTETKSKSRTYLTKLLVLGSTFFGFNPQWI
jgi:hypothetical protein